jgi:hypothetical protein
MLFFLNSPRLALYQYKAPETPSALVGVTFLYMLVALVSLKNYESVDELNSKVNDTS